MSFRGLVLAPFAELCPIPPFTEGLPSRRNVQGTVTTLKDRGCDVLDALHDFEGRAHRFRRS